MEPLDRRAALLLAIAGAGLIAGIAAHTGGRPDLATLLWTAGVLPVLAALAWEIVASLRAGDVGLDIVAALSMSAALVFGETLAAAVVAVMYAGGTFLEAFAAGRARREMTGLLARAPRSTLRHQNGGLVEVEIGAVRPGDRLMIRQGDILPVDGAVAAGTAVLDLSALTGEPMPVRLGPGEAALSGAANAGGAFDLIAARRADESTYAGIVRLVEAAQRSKAPMARLADRYALGFLAVTVAIAGTAWALSGDPVRAVAVLVVATPCPLILAVPVALVSGLSRAARYGVLIKGGKALETMARVTGLVLDKTGTLTEGRPRIAQIVTAGTLAEDEALRLAATLEQASRHPIAQAFVAEARARGLALAPPGSARETAGEGVEGEVEGRTVAIGGLRFARDLAGEDGPALPELAREPGMVTAALAVEGRIAALFVLSDPLRAGSTRLMEAMRSLGIERILLATGDRAEVARQVTRGLGFDAVRAGLTPDEKVLVVLSERKHGPVMMVGDGVNDAPALAAADLGVAMGATGAAASAEAADVVLLVDRLDRAVTGIEIAQGARAIAVQSVVAGIGLSVAGMVAAALGYLQPVEGAILQEVIDIAVILNALRALRIVPRHGA